MNVEGKENSATNTVSKFRVFYDFRFAPQYDLAHSYVPHKAS